MQVKLYMSNITSENQNTIHAAEQIALSPNSIDSVSGLIYVNKMSDSRVQQEKKSLKNICGWKSERNALYEMLLFVRQMKILIVIFFCVWFFSHFLVTPHHALANCQLHTFLNTLHGTVYLFSSAFISVFSFRCCCCCYFSRICLFLFNFSIICWKVLWSRCKMGIDLYRMTDIKYVQIVVTCDKSV